MTIKTQVLDHPQKSKIEFNKGEILESNPVEITTIDFNDNTPKNLQEVEYGSNRPIVYILNNNNEAYIGQSLDASKRASQHLKKEDRRRLSYISVLGDNKFNASVVLDLESFLIKHMSADGLFKLQNSNGGLQDFNYPDKEKFQKCFNEIRKGLQTIGLAKNTIQRIENSDDFKFSPYKQLTDDQENIINDILTELADDIINNEKSTFLVKGGAGTGKTIVGIYLLKLLKTAIGDYIFYQEHDDEDNEDEDNKIYIKGANVLKIGYVTSLSNLKDSIDNLFKGKKKRKKLVFTPNEIARYKGTFDLLIVDEAHRLKYRRALANYKSFDNGCKNLGLDPLTTSELDWIIQKSKHQILFYDPIQKVRPADVQPEDFAALEKKENTHVYTLKTQLRISAGGEKYMKYIGSILSNNPPTEKRLFSNYDFKLYMDADKMINKIKDLDKEYMLCRNVGGYAWKRFSKAKKKKGVLIKPKQDRDIDIDGHHYKWNSTTVGRINSSNAINEIGSIHTVQGFDLNYCGVIIGGDIKYKEGIGLYADRANYFDTRGKDTTTDEELLEYILNIYGVLCTRGIRGTFIYACDPGVRKYLSKYIEVVE